MGLYGTHQKILQWQLLILKPWLNVEHPIKLQVQETEKMLPWQQTLSIFSRYCQKSITHT